LSDLTGNVTVRVFDVRQDELEEGSYDLVHCRALLMHLNDPVGALGRMAAALRPGGILLAEEVDYGLFAFHGHPDVDRLNSAIHRFCAAGRDAEIADPYIGRRLPGMLALAGLEVLDTEVTGEVASLGQAHYEFHRMSDAQMMPTYVRLGGYTEADAALLASFWGRPGTVVTCQTVFSAWGRR